jgi:hypothetical protein
VQRQQRDHARVVEPAFGDGDLYGPRHLGCL